MRVLFLTPYKENQLVDFLEALRYDIIPKDGKLKLEEIKEIDPHFIISYGYSHIIKSPVIKEYPKILNLHIAYLPWNGGCDPNFWSWLEHTPKGYSIHYIDEGIDTGPILFQKEIEKFDKNETLATTYNKLKNGIEELFIENWNLMANGGIEFKQQNSNEGNYHKLKDIEKYKFLMEDKGWDTPVKKIENYGKKKGLWILK